MPVTGLRNLRQRQAGLSLIELMISITLGLLIVAALVAVFSQNSASFRQNDANAQMQDNARFALDALSRDLSMAGYYGGVFDGGSITLSGGSKTALPALAVDCGPAYSDSNGTFPWAFYAAFRLEFYNGSSAGTPFTPCLGQADTPVQAGSDVLAIRRSAGQSAADFASGASTAPQLCDHTYYLQSNGTQGAIISTSQMSSCTTFADYTENPPTYPPMSFYKWVPRVYFVRTYSRTANDGIPTLCRMELQHTATPTMQVECIADGVEKLKIEWGLDNDAVPDCVPDTWTSNPSQTQLANAVVAARIWLIARTTQLDGSYTDTKTFTIAGVAYPPPDPQSKDAHYHRRLYTTTVQLRNPVGAVGPCTPH